MDERPPPPPPGHERIGSDGLDYLTVKDGHLYWHGAKLKSESKVRLSWPQGIGAFLVTVSAVVGAGAASLSAYAALETLNKERAERIRTTPTSGNIERIAVFTAYFDSGASVPRPQSETSLANALLVLRDNPQSRAVIRAYTDDRGSADLNRRLADERAENVRQYLTGNGVAPQRIAMQSPAADSPRADNSTMQGRRQNRRVDIDIQSRRMPLTR